MRSGTEDDIARKLVVAARRGAASTGQSAARSATPAMSQPGGCRSEEIGKCMPTFKSPKAKRDAKRPRFRRWSEADLFVMFRASLFLLLMPATKTSALGWENCARLVNDHAELLVTLDVGPRILSYKTTGGENVLRTFPDQMGKSGERNFQVRGGHRVWVAPEGDLTNVPDNGPVEVEWMEPNGMRAAAAANGPARIRREMTVSRRDTTRSLMSAAV